MSAEKIHAQAVELVIEIHGVLTQAFGPDLAGSARGELVSSHFLAMIRDRMRGYVPERPAQICDSCIDLRQRLINVYHLTLTGADPAATVRAVRAASGPGAPSPGVTLTPERPEASSFDAEIGRIVRENVLQNTNASDVLSDCFTSAALRTLCRGKVTSPAPEPKPPARCGCNHAELLSKLDSQGRMLEECANTLAIAGYGDLAWRGHAMRKATRAECPAAPAAPDPKPPRGAQPGCDCNSCEAFRARERSDEAARISRKLCGPSCWCAGGPLDSAGCASDGSPDLCEAEDA